jgi:hypothetical protein
LEVLQTATAKALGHGTESGMRLAREAYWTTTCNGIVWLMVPEVAVIVTAYLSARL